VWEGVAFRQIAKLTAVKPEAMWVMFHCASDYTTPVPLEDAIVEDSLVATKMNGKPIPLQQGYPARPFIPHLYGWKSEVAYGNRISRRIRRRLLGKPGL
jgi:DMSO/TMAO reductase YedYZ molybdopterin-dependent catalytic subunit